MGLVAIASKPSAAVAAAEIDDVTNANQEDFDLSEEIVNDISKPGTYKVNVIVSYFSVAGRIVAPLAAQNKIVNFIIE